MRMVGFTGISTRCIITMECHTSITITIDAAIIMSQELYHKVLKYYSDIKKQVRRDKLEVEMRKTETYQRLKLKQILKREEARMDSRKRIKG